jgi:lactocepin
MVSLTEKNLYPYTINVGTKYKGYAVTEIKNKKYGLNDVKVNNKGKVVVYAEKEENVQICVDGKFFGNKSTDKPSKVTSLKQKASYATNAITLTWNKVSGANGYEVYRATSKNGKYTKVASVTKTSYKDSKLKAGKTYYYKVCAYKSVEGTKLCGDYSAIVVAGTQTAKPSLKVVAGKKKATLTWKKVSGADGYELQMSTSKSGNYKKIKTVNSKTVKYTKSKLTKGKKYFFKMRTYRTVGGKKIYSSWSAVKSVKIK